MLRSTHRLSCAWFAGTYGEVYSAIDRTTGKQVAIKILETITDNLEEIEEEYLVLRDLSHHQNLPSFIDMFLRKGACFEDDQLWFVMEVSQFACEIQLFFDTAFSKSQQREKTRFIVEIEFMASNIRARVKR